MKLKSQISWKIKIFLETGWYIYAKKYLTMIFFTACLTYVVIRSYECYLKFSETPEAVKNTLRFTGQVTFPSVTFCPDWDNRDNLTKFPRNFKENVLEECNMTVKNYQDGPWTSKNCTDADLLYHR